MPSSRQRPFVPLGVSFAALLSIPSCGGSAAEPVTSRFEPGGASVVDAAEALLASPIDGFDLAQLMTQKLADGTHIREGDWLHCGLDLRFVEADDGETCVPVVAPADGVVTQAGDPEGRDGSGFTITIRHAGVALAPLVCGA